MFETLEPREQVVGRQLPLIVYGTYCLVGLVFLVLGVRRHGFAQPFGLGIAALMFLLSLAWFVMAFRAESPMSNRTVRIRTFVLLLLLTVHGISSI
jgi:hypothetical protein